MANGSNAKALVHTHGFELMQRDRLTEVYRKGDRFLVREGERWQARRGRSSNFVAWTSPKFDDSLVALTYAELAEWDGPWSIKDTK